MLPSLWSKLKSWCYHSLTVFWGYTQIFMAALLLSAHEIYDVMGSIITDPGVKSALDSLHLPAYIGLALAVFGCITIAARLRTVTKPTNASNQIVT